MSFSNFGHMLITAPFYVPLTLYQCPLVGYNLTPLFQPLDTE